MLGGVDGLVDNVGKLLLYDDVAVGLEQQASILPSVVWM